MAIEGTSVGTARIDIVADATKAEAQLKAIQGSVQSFGAEAQAQYNAATAAQKRYADSQIRQIALDGQSALAKKALNAQLKIGGALGDEIAAKATAAANAQALAQARYTDAQLLAANRALASYKEQTSAAQAAAQAQAELAAADEARLQKIAADAAAEIEARKAVTAATMEQARANAELAAATSAKVGGTASAVINPALSPNNVQQQIADYAALDAIMGKKVATTEEVAAAEAALDRLQAAGMISTEELSEAFAALDVVTAAETKALQANSVAQVENAAATKINSRTQYELGIMLGEVASGNVNRLKRSTAALANSTGLLKAIMTPTGLGITAGVAALALFGKAVYDREQDLLEFDKALAATGDYAGTTGLQLQGIAAVVGASTGQYSNAAKAVLALAQSGSVVGNQMQKMAEIAVNMSYITGQSVESIAKELIKLQGDPTQSIVKLTDVMGLLTSAQYNQIVETQQQQGAVAAAALAMKDLATASDDARSKLVDNAGVVIRSWEGFKNLLSDTWHLIGSIGATQSTGELLAIQERRLKDLQAQVTPTNGVAQSPTYQREVADAQAQIAALQRQQTSEAMFSAGQGLANQAKEEHDKALAEALAYNKQGDEGFVAQAAAINKKRYEALVGIVDPAIRDRVNAAYDQQIRDAVKRANAEYRGGSSGGRTKKPSQAGPNALFTFQQQVDALGAHLDSDNSPIGKYTQGIAKLTEEFDKATHSGANVTAATDAYARGVASLNDALKRDQALQASQIKAYKDALDQETAARKQQLDAQIASYGMSQKEAQRMQELAQITQQVSEKITELTAKRNALLAAHPGADTTELDAEIKAQKDSLATRLSDQQAFYQETDKMQANSLLGFEAGMKDFVDQQKDMYDQSKQFVQNFANGFSDAFAQFASGAESGKKAFGDFMDSLYQQALKFVANQAISKLFGLLSNNNGNSMTGLFGGFSQSSTDTTAGDIVSSIYGDGGGSSSGGFWSSLISGIFGGGRAEGGQVSAGGLFRVNENGPELLNVGNQSFLMMGNRDGTVTPNSQLRGAGQSVTVNQTVVVQGLSNRRTREQLAQETATRQRIAVARS